MRMEFAMETERYENEEHEVKERKHFFANSSNYLFQNSLFEIYIKSLEQFTYFKEMIQQESLDLYEIVLFQIKNKTRKLNEYCYMVIVMGTFVVYRNRRNVGNVICDQDIEVSIPIGEES